MVLNLNNNMISILSAASFDFMCNITAICIYITLQFLSNMEIISYNIDAKLNQ